MTARQPGNPPRDYTLLIPPGWIRLPIDDRAEAVVAKLVAGRFQPLPPDKRDLARRRASETLLDLVGRARSNGGVEVFLSVDPIRGMPVTASCLVSLQPVASGRGSTDALLAGFGEEYLDAEVGTVAVAGMKGVRRRYTAPPEDREPAPPNTRLDYLVPLPGGQSVLVLTFSTVTQPVVEELIQLFDAIAATLRWRW